MKYVLILELKKSNNLVVIKLLILIFKLNEYDNNI